MYATILNNKATRTAEHDAKVNKNKPKCYKNNHKMQVKAQKESFSLLMKYKLKIKY